MGGPRTLDCQASRTGVHPTVELMSQKARDLDEAVQQTLKYAAALGNRFDLEAAIKTADLAANAVVYSQFASA